MIYRTFSNSLTLLSDARLSSLRFKVPSSRRLNVVKILICDGRPRLTEAQLEALILHATTYALSHGLLYLPAVNPQSPAPVSPFMPISIFHHRCPRRTFELAWRLQKAYNVLYSRIALDEAFLDRVMGEVEGVGKVDDFVGTMWRGCSNYETKRWNSSGEYRERKNPNNIEADIERLASSTWAFSLGLLVHAPQRIYL